MKMIAQNKNQVIFMWFEHFEMLNKLKKKNKYMLCFFAINIAIIFVDDFEKFFIKVDKVLLIEKQLKNRISSKFHKYVRTWNLVETNKFFSRREWNHRIDFKSKSTSSIKKTYDLLRDQALVIKKYVNDMLDKDFIKSNSFEYATLVLIIKKFEDDLRLCVNYRVFNVFTIKNRNASSFIRETLIRFCFAKIYSKFDIIVVFNEMRIKKKDEKKTIFLTRYELFEYVVISFELCNAFDTFQVFINATLREYLNDFCTEYSNDVLIFNENKTKHVEHVFKIFVKFEKANLYFDIDKCEFFVTSIKYLELIIITEKIKMNFKKIDVTNCQLKVF